MADVERINGSGILRREWRELARFFVESFVAGLVVSIVLGLAVFIANTPAHATPVRMAAAAAAAVPGPAADADTGALYLKDAGGARTSTPLLFTDVAIDVSGMVARVTVAQRFVNPTAEWREGVYVFPLPEKSAVDHLRMQVGERTIEGLIKERGEARATYEAARSEGRKTTLVEQERPNMFTTSVANIGPHEEIVVTIEYQETLRYDDGTFRLRFPMAITPRYIPGTPVESAGGGIGWSPATQQVLDADRITPPVADRHEGYVNPVRIRVDLRAGFPLAKLSSTYHAVDVDEDVGHRYRMTLADGPIPAARDFEITWTPDVGAAPGTALFTETKGGKTYALLMALPPSNSAAAAGRTAPREITYIVDTSGSMEGVSIAQAREALLLALDRLQPGDRFNVIEFNSIANALYPAPVPLDRETLARARQFVSGLRCPRRHGNAARAGAGAGRAARGDDDAPGRVPDRRRRRQRGRDPQARARAHRRPPDVHRRHRTRAQRVLHDPCSAVRPRHLHVHRRRARSEGKDDRPLPQAGKPRTDRHRRRVAGRRGRLAARRAGPLCGRAGDRRRAVQRQRGRRHGRGVGTARRHDMGHGAARRRDGERAGRGRAVGTGEDRRADGRGPQGRAGGRDPRRGPRRRAHPSPRQQVHEPRGRRRDADAAGRDRGFQNRAARQHSRWAYRLRPAAAHGDACAVC